MICLLSKREREFEEEANRLAVGGIPEELLSLSPLHLPSPFLNENVLAAIDPYGSNVNLIDAGTAAILQTPTSSQGDHAIERSSELTERALKGLSVQEREHVGRVGGTEDASGPTTALVVPNPIPVAANLATNEELPILTLGVSDENPTLPPGEDGIGSNPDDPENDLKGMEEDLGEPSTDEQGNVEGVENPPDSTTDRVEDTSDSFGAQVAGENLDRAED